MTQVESDWLARYQPYRRRVEIGFWVAVLGLESLFNSVVAWIDLRRSSEGFPYWKPALWELSSVLVVALLIPAMIAFERRFPLHWKSVPQHLGAHLAASVAYCVLHVGLMYAIRYAVYALVGEPYGPQRWVQEFLYQYLKDVRSYTIILATILGYRFLLLRLQGEARVLDPADPPVLRYDTGRAPAAPTRPERFLVRKLRTEFLIAAADIEWLQAQGNYVGLHVNGHDYLLRSTLAGFLEQLDPARFTQVHRSYAVNLDRIAAIEPTDGGDATLRMKDGSQVPCSRRYRDALAGPA